MSDEVLLDALLFTWLERLAEGEDVPTSMLCADRPDLIPELEGRIEAQRRLLALTRAVAETDSSTSASPAPDATLPETEVHAPPTPPLIIPGYEVLEELGRGG